MNILEVILLVLVVIALLVGIQAHRDHLSFKAQANADLDAAKAKLSALEAKIPLLEHKVDNPVAVTLTPSPSSPPSPASATATAS